MKNVLIFLILVLVFSSCTKKFCQENYPCPPDSIRIENNISIDTLWYQMPADTEFVQTAIDCPDQQIIYREGKTQTKIVIKDKVITVNRTTQRDSIQLLSLTRELKYYKQIIKEKPTPIIIYKNPWYFKYILYTFAILLVFNIIRFRKTLFSFFRRVRF